VAPAEKEFFIRRHSLSRCLIVVSVPLLFFVSFASAAGEKVVVAAEVFRRRMNHQIRALLEQRQRATEV